MKIICLADTHTHHKKVSVPDGDILIHAGDFTEDGTIQELKAFSKWLKKLPHKHKIICAGNHEFCIEKDSEQCRNILQESCIYLQGESIRIENTRFYGHPWTPRFCSMAFNVDRGSKEILELCRNIPINTDVLISHGPPDTILDQTYSQKFVGCQAMLHRVANLNLKAHIFGHIHASYGTQTIGNTQFVNAAICISPHLPLNDPIIIDI